MTHIQGSRSHSLAVYFPIVFVWSLAAFDIVALVRGPAIRGRGAVANVSAGPAMLAGLAVVVAYTFGDIAFDIAKAAGASVAPLELHSWSETVAAPVGLPRTNEPSPTAPLEIWLLLMK